MMVRSNHTRCIKEADNDPAAHNPAREANEEGLGIPNEKLISWEVGVRQICNWVDARFTFELLSQVFGVVLNDIIIPFDIKTPSMASPAHKENGSPK